MVRWLKSQRQFMSFGTGLMAGLLIGVGMLVGAIVATNNRHPAVQFPEQLLHASGMRIRRDESGHLPADASLFEQVAEYERRRIIEALDKTNYSQTDAAEMLRVPLSTLNQKIKRLSIDVKRRTAGS